MRHPASAGGAGWARDVARGRGRVGDATVWGGESGQVGRWSQAIKSNAKSIRQLPGAVNSRQGAREYLV